MFDNHGVVVVVLGKCCLLRCYPLEKSVPYQRNKSIRIININHLY